MQNVPYCSYNRTPGTLAFVEKMGQEHVEETEVDSSERLERRISLEREWGQGQSEIQEDLSLNGGHENTFLGM